MLKHTVIGFGLGILTISSLTVTIIFAHYSNKMSTYEKYTIRVSMNNMSSIYDSSIAIAVLGCFAFIFSLLAITTLSFYLMQCYGIFLQINRFSVFSLLLLIFGCLVAEGIISQKIQNQYAYELSNSYDNGLLQTYWHKSAKNYIKKSIKELYQQGEQNIYTQNSSIQFSSWSEIENAFKYVHCNLGTCFNLAYGNLWNDDETLPIFSKPYISFSLNQKNGIISANLNTSGNLITVPVAITKFLYEDSFQKKKRVCWYKNAEKDNIKCTNVKDGYQIENKTVFDASEFLLSEAIIESKENNGQITKSFVSNFPVAFKLLTNSEYDSIEEKLDSDFGVKDSSCHYKISGKKWAKALYKKQIEPEKNPSKYGSFYLTSFKPTSYQDAINNCQNYSESSIPICNEYEFEEVALYLKKIDMDSRLKSKKKIKIPSFIKKHYNSYGKSELNNYLTSTANLYHIAIGNLIVQIFGILILFAGYFQFLHNFDDVSENEAN